MSKKSFVNQLSFIINFFNEMIMMTKKKKSVSMISYIRFVNCSKHKRFILDHIQTRARNIRFPFILLVAVIYVQYYVHIGCQWLGWRLYHKLYGYTWMDMKSILIPRRWKNIGNRHHTSSRIHTHISKYTQEYIKWKQCKCFNKVLNDQNNKLTIQLRYNGESATLLLSPFSFYLILLLFHWERNKTQTE